jgi:hypothetical protein
VGFFFLKDLTALSSKGLPNDERSATQQKIHSSNAAWFIKTKIVVIAGVYHLHTNEQYLIFGTWTKHIEDLNSNLKWQKKLTA